MNKEQHSPVDRENYTLQHQFVGRSLFPNTHGEEIMPESIHGDSDTISGQHKFHVMFMLIHLRRDEKHQDVKWWTTFLTLPLYMVLKI